MRVPAIVFEPERVHCPSCFFPTNRGADVCERCGFSDSGLVQKIPFQPPQMAAVVDVENRFEPSDVKKIEKAIARFQKRAPQFRVSVHLTRLPEGGDVREFGYWLFNHCPFAEGETPEDRAGTLLILIDRESRSAGLTVGYRLDPFLGDDTGSRLFGQAKDGFLASDYAGGVADFLQAVATHFRKIAEPASYAAERYRRAPRPDLHAQ